MTRKECDGSFILYIFVCAVYLGEVIQFLLQESQIRFLTAPFLS